MIKPTASLFWSSFLVDSSFLRHSSPRVFWIPSNLANLLAETLVLGLPHDISPFPSLHEVISGFSGTLLLSLSKHMAILIIMSWSNSMFILLMRVQVNLIGRSELANWPFCQACPSGTVLWPSPWLTLLFPLTCCDITSVTLLRIGICLASSLSVACKLMLKHAKSRIYMGSHAVGMTPYIISSPRTRYVDVIYLAIFAMQALSCFDMMRALVIDLRQIEPSPARITGYILAMCSKNLYGGSYNPLLPLSA